MVWFDHVPPLIVFGHAPPVHVSVNAYHILPVLIRSIHGSHPSSLTWNSHDTTIYTTSTFKVVLASKSWVRPSPFSTNHLRVSPGCRGRLGRDHPWSNIITGSCIISPFSANETSFLHTSAFKAVPAIGTGIRPSIYSPSYLRVFSGPVGCFGCCQQWSKPIRGAFITSLLICPKTASLWPSNHSWSWMEQSDHLSLFLWFNLCFRV